jgi:transmembrane sensor
MQLKFTASDVGAFNQAATWFARQRAGRWSDEDGLEFARWLKADPMHTAAWTEYERLWGRLEAVRDNPRILAFRENARRNIKGRSSWRMGWRMAATIAASILLGVGSWRWLTPLLSRSPILAREIVTEIGERSIVVLPDGSKVTLNTASAVRTDYSGRERRVILVRGEAFFDVAKDPTRPFVVSARSRQVVAVGTAFDVRLQDRQLRVTLVDGRVRVVEPSADAASTSASSGLKRHPAVTLEAGTALIVRDDGADLTERLDADRATSWRTGRLIFDGDRLADVIAEMNRYSREKLVIADASLENRKVSGVFEPANDWAFAKALEAYGIARATRQSGTTIVLDAP